MKVSDEEHKRASRATRRVRTVLGGVLLLIRLEESEARLVGALDVLAARVELLRIG